MNRLGVIPPVYMSNFKLTTMRKCGRYLQIVQNKWSMARKPINLTKRLEIQEALKTSETQTEAARKVDLLNSVFSLEMRRGGGFYEYDPYKAEEYCKAKNRAARARGCYLKRQRSAGTRSELSKKITALHQAGNTFQEIADNLGFSVWKVRRHFRLAVMETVEEQPTLDRIDALEMAVSVLSEQIKELYERS